MAESHLASGLGFLYATMEYLSPSNQGSVQWGWRPLYSYQVFFSRKCLVPSGSSTKSPPASRKISEEADEARPLVPVRVPRAHEVLVQRELLDPGVMATDLLPYGAVAHHI